MCGGIRRRRRARAGALAATAVVAVVLTGCSEPLAGTATIAPYRPLSAASMSADMADPIPDAVSYSRDGRTVAMYRDSAVCVGQADDPDEAPVCPTLPGDLDIGQALLDPTGRTLAVLEDFQQTYQGRLWLVDTDSGDARRVPFPHDDCGVPASDSPSTVSGSPGDTTGSSTAGSTGTATSGTDANTDESNGPPQGMYTYGTWQTDGRLTAIGLSRNGSECLVVIDPTDNGTPRPVTVSDAVPPRSYVSNVPEAGGSTLVFLLRPEDDEPPTVDVVDVRTGDHRQLDLPKAIRTMHAGLPVMAVSSDGSTAVVGGTNLETSRPTPIVTLDLSDGSVDRLTTAPDGTAMDAAFSPDGAQVLVAIRGDEDGQNRFAVVDADGGTPRTVATWQGSYTPVLDMRWTRANLIVPASLRVDVDLSSFGPVQLSD